MTVFPAEVGVVRVARAIAIFDPGQSWMALVMWN